MDKGLPSECNSIAYRGEHIPPKHTAGHSFPRRFRVAHALIPLQRAKPRTHSAPHLRRDPSDEIWKHHGRIWVPENYHELQPELVVSAHSGTVGHRGFDATASISRKTFWWTSLDRDTSTLVRGCIYGIFTRSEKTFPRPLGMALHGSRPNEVLHMDYLYMVKCTDRKRYIVIIRDDPSSYTWIWPTHSCNAENAAEALGK